MVHVYHGTMVPWYVLEYQGIDLVRTGVPLVPNGTNGTYQREVPVSTRRAHQSTKITPKFQHKVVFGHKSRHYDILGDLWRWQGHFFNLAGTHNNQLWFSAVFFATSCIDAMLPWYSSTIGTTILEYHGIAIVLEYRANKLRDFLETEDFSSVCSAEFVCKVWHRMGQTKHP